MDRSKLDALKANLGAASTGCIIKNGYLVYSWGNIAANYGLGLRGQALSFDHAVRGHQ